MKIRIGFVSNSSSTSFCVIGIENDLWIDLILEKAGVDRESISHPDQGVFNIIKGFNCYGDYTPRILGLDAKTSLDTMTLPQSKEHFKEVVNKKFGLNIPIEHIRLLYGEAGE